jgi:hypothetical protein
MAFDPEAARSAGIRADARFDGTIVVIVSAGVNLRDNGILEKKCTARLPIL